MTAQIASRYHDAGHGLAGPFSGEHGLGATDDSPQWQISGDSPPPGFPQSIKGPGVWSGQQEGCDAPFILELDRGDEAEVQSALDSFKRLELNGDEVNCDRFPLPRLGSRLRACAHEIHQGPGVCLLRGLDPGRYSIEDSTVIFLGLSAYIGDQRGPQSSKGEMLSHVVDSKEWTVPRPKRHGIHTNGELPYHNDVGTEILALQVRDCALEGGRLCVSSAAAIYNELIKTQPGVVRALAHPSWPVRISRQSPPFVLAPLLFFHDGHLIISMDPARLGPHPSELGSSSRGSIIPQLNPLQREALAAVQAAAARHALRLQIRAGDVAFLHNWALLHARESYVDGHGNASKDGGGDGANKNDDGSEPPSTVFPQREHQRHLVRLWLRSRPLGWAIPAGLRPVWDAVFGDGARRIRRRQYPVAPLPEYHEPRYSCGTAAFVPDEDEDEDDDDNFSKDGVWVEELESEDGEGEEEEGLKQGGEAAADGTAGY